MKLTEINFMINLNSDKTLKDFITFQILKSSMEAQKLEDFIKLFINKFEWNLNSMKIADFFLKFDNNLKSFFYNHLNRIDEEEGNDSSNSALKSTDLSTLNILSYDHTLVINIIALLVKYSISLFGYSGNELNKLIKLSNSIT